MSSIVSAGRLRDLIHHKGYAVQSGEAASDLVGKRGWQVFQESWENLPVDRWMRDGSTYRKRRYGRFALGSDGAGFSRMPHGPFYQAVEVNSYAGGTQRHFEPIEPVIGNCDLLFAIVMADFEIFRPADATRGWWEIQVHQVRIEGEMGKSSAPTPEGLHRDGHDFLGIHLIGRSNLSGGVTVIADSLKNEIQRVLLQQPLDSLYLDDRSVLHYVNPVERVDDSEPGFRDVLVVDFDFRPILAD